MTRLLVVALALVLSLPLAVALAHAEPRTVSPGDGAVLRAAPAQVSIEVTQDLFKRDGANDIDVFGAFGQEVTVEAAVIDPGDRRRMSVNLPASLSPGRYEVRWKTLSADDGDDASGSFSFTIDPGAAPAPGRRVLKEGESANGDEQPAVIAAPGVDEPGTGASWILPLAVGAGMFVAGLGAAYVLGLRPR